MYCLTSGLLLVVYFILLRTAVFFTFVRQIGRIFMSAGADRNTAQGTIVFMLYVWRSSKLTNMRTNVNPCLFIHIYQQVIGYSPALGVSWGYAVLLNGEPITVLQFEIVAFNIIM